MRVDRRRTRKIAFRILITALILVSLFAYLRYRDLKKILILKASEKATSMMGQEVHVADIAISIPAALNFYDITIKNPGIFSPGQLLRIKRIRIDIRLGKLLKGNLSFKKIILYSPELTLLKDDKGRLNISDALMRLLSQKSTTRYQVDEFRIESGIFHFNGDEKYRSDHINLRLEDLSSHSDTRTKIKGTLIYTGNRIGIDGWVYLNDMPKKFNLSLSSKDFTLSAFRKLIEAYKIDTEKTRMDIVLHAEGDTEIGFHITSDLRLRKVGFFLFSKDIKGIRLRTTAMLSLRDYSLDIQAASLFINGASTATLNGTVEDLKQNPSYRAEVKIDGLDLSGLNFMKDFKVSGILASNNLRLTGNLETKVPNVSGDFRLREGSIESRQVTMEKINADLRFSSDREISIQGEVSARIVKAGEYLTGSPVDTRLSTSIEGSQRQMKTTSFLSLSPLEIRLDGGRKVSLGQSTVMIEGMMKGENFSGKNSLEIREIRFADRFIPWFRSSYSIDYQKPEVTIKNLTFETEGLKSSAEHLGIIMRQTGNDYGVELKGVNAAYQEREAVFKQGDLYLGLQTNSKTISGEFRFSAGNIMLQGITFNHVSGNGSFDEQNFSLNISQVEFSGGKIRLAAGGRASQNPFPIKAKVIADGIDLSLLSNSLPKSLSLPYTVKGDIQQATFEGIIDAQESLLGNGFLEARKVSVSNPSTGRNFVKDASFRAEIESKGKDLAFKSEAVAGTLSTRLSGRVEGFLKPDRHLQVKGTLPEVKVSDIRDSLWDIFPDSLLYVGMQGSVSSSFSVDYSKSRLDMKGNLLFTAFALEGENGEYSLGPINGTLPIGYSKGRGDQEITRMPSFQKSQFELLINDFSREPKEEDFQRVTIGSLRYGFQLFDHINLWIKPKGSYLNIERFSANIFGGKLYGSGVIDLSSEFRYRAGLLVKGISLTKLCDSIEPIQGYISGNADGIASLKGSGIRISQLIGMADFWTYRTSSEKTVISKEFLRKIGGSSLKGYLRDRQFDKGILNLYLRDGDLIFKELEISNRNFLGITDLSVKVAPMSNRIALDHLLWTIAEAAERAKKKN
ncbi:MAG: hypothetical protein A2157_06070 [Deltaproteobacteria bacterium RBG_16_47_11]|nr:MAG: hypothetical protein A2157_06070 [Deltaproteobacteria bacterium RBG_16_47_11]